MPKGYDEINSRLESYCDESGTLNADSSELTPLISGIKPSLSLLEASGRSRLANAVGTGIRTLFFDTKKPDASAALGGAAAELTENAVQSSFSFGQRLQDRVSDLSVVKRRQYDVIPDRDDTVIYRP